MSTTPNRLRKKEVKIRLSESEYDEFMKRKPEGLPLAEWVRSVCLNQEIRHAKKIKIADPNLLTSLARIGNNMNQIAKRLNAQKNEPLQLKTLVELSVIKDNLEALKKAHL